MRSEDLKDLERALRDLSRVIRGLNAALGGQLAPLASLTPWAGLFSAGLGLYEAISRQPSQPEIHYHIQINIAEGQISERAFWDNLVQYYILPSIQRGGLAPMPQGGRG